MASASVFKVAKENNVADLSNLIREYGHSLVDDTDPSGKTPICVAIENNSVDVIRWLIENGCRLSNCSITDSDTTTKHECEPLHPVKFYPPLLAAVAQHSIEISTLLLESGRVHIDESFRNVTPLIKACVENLPDMVSLLLDHGADVNGLQISDDDLDLDTDNPREWEHRPLYHAVENCNGDIVELLAKRGAHYVRLSPLPCHSFSFWSTQTTQLQRCWGSILELAVVKFCPKVEFLLDFYCDKVCCVDVYYALVLGVRAQKMDIVQLLLDKYYRQPDGNIPGRLSLGDSYWMVIRLAVRECKEDETIPKLLLDRFGVLLADNEDRSRIVSLLFVAVLRNLPETVGKIAFVLTSHFDIVALKECPSAGTLLRDVRGMALYQGNLKILRTLYEADLLDLDNYPEASLGVLSCQRTGTGATVLGALTWLKELGFDPRYCRAGNMQPIQASVKQRLPEAIDALCQLGVDANSELCGRERLSPLHLHLDLCIQQLGMDPDLSLMEELLGHGADLAVVNAHGYTPLSILFWIVQNNTRKDEENGCQQQQVCISRHYRAAWDRTLSSAFQPVDPLPEQVSAVTGIRNQRASSSDDSDGVHEDGDFLVVHNSGVYNNRSRLSPCMIPDLSLADDALSPEECKDLPLLLTLKSHRAFVKKIANKFGARLLSMGAATLVGEENWHRVDKHLRGAGIAWRYVPSLKTCCWTTVRHSLGGVDFREKVDSLPLPSAIKDFLEKL